MKRSKKPPGGGDRARDWKVFCTSRNSAPLAENQDPFTGLRRAYTALEADPDNDFLRVALMKASLSYRHAEAAPS